jgi:hypothetical protein
MSGNRGRRLVWHDPDGSQFHEAGLLRTPEGRMALIDEAMVPLVNALWHAGFTTITCCQDIGESTGDLSPRRSRYWAGRAMLELPLEDAKRLAALAAAHGFMRHWADDDAWDMSIPLTVIDGTPWLPALVQVYFPAGQLDAVTDMIRAEAVRVRGGQ